MAVANTKSTHITNADATPPTLTNSHISNAVKREAVGTVEVAAADDDGSVYRLARVPSSARVSTVQLACDALTGATVADIGLYKTAKEGGAVVDADLFASNVDISAGVAFTDYTYEATATNIVQVEKRLWELLGLTADPQIDYDVCVTLDTAGSGAGTLAMRVEYVI